MPSSKIHEGYYYASEQALTDRLVRLVQQSLTDDRILILALTREHHEMLDARLRREQIDFDDAVRRAQIKLLDARTFLDQLFDGKTINRKRFDGAFKSLLQEALLSGKGLTVCGEIVNVLWAEGHRDAALQLEQLWDEVLQKHSFQLYCVYASSAAGAGHATFKRIDILHGARIA